MFGSPASFDPVDISVKPLFARESAAWSRAEKQQPWIERDAVILVTDLRRSETSTSSHRLAHDTAYVLYPFYEAFGDAVQSTGGFLCGYAGPEDSAVFGLSGELEQACRQALEAIGLIEDFVQRLNSRLASDIGPLGEFVLAAHRGSVVSGMMGHPDAQVPLAVGLAVDDPKRLPDHAHSTGSGCVLSKSVLEGAGRTRATMAWHDVDRNQDDLPLQVRVGASLSECPAEGAKYTGFPASL